MQAMAILFSAVTVIAGKEKTEFFVGEISPVLKATYDVTAFGNCHFTKTGRLTI